MVALVVVVLDEAPDLRFEITRQVIVLQKYPVLERLVPPLDLALGLGVEVLPLEWSILRYGFSKEDHDGKKEAFS